MQKYIEEWQIFPSFPNYLVSNLGNVKNKEGQLRKFCYNKQGYQRLLFSKPGHKRQWRSIASCVLETFVELRPKGFTASHVDGNKLNNKINNLVWETLKKNIRRCKTRGTKLRGEQHHSAKLSNNQVTLIKQIRQNDKLSHRELAKLFNISSSAIYLILNNKRRQYDSYRNN